MKIKLNTIYVLYLIFISFLFTSKVNCDLPVHCHLDQIIGTWDYFVDTKVFKPSLDNEEMTCGHGFPNRVVNTVGNALYYLESYKQFTITLKSDMKVYEDNKIVGDFLLIYDEAMIVNYKSSVFTFHFRYYKENATTKEYKSDCSKTMMGWYVKDYILHKDKDWSCFYGSKKYSSDNNKPMEWPDTHNDSLTFLQNHLSRFNKYEMMKKIKEEDKLKEKEALKDIQNPLINVKYEDNNEIVEEMNKMGLTWKAGFNEQFRGKTLKELNEHPGYGYKKKRTLKKSPVPNLLSSRTLNFIQTETKNNIRAKSQTKINKVSETLPYSEFSKYLKTDAKDIPDSVIPTNWDWRNVGGNNYVPKVRNQGDCGSCYVFASLSSLESRLRIKTNNNDQTEFSRQFILSCGIYTEGCDGGYPILVGKFAHEFELLPEECMPYDENNLKCSNRCNNFSSIKKYSVGSYGYIGGYYGFTNESLMMKEIFARGPIPGSMLVPWTFSFYKEGIYSHKEFKKNSGKLNKATLFDKHLLWEEVQHSILIIGWGVENGVKYWLCMNSWGEQWGDKGFFKILRGEDSEHIESMGDILNIEVTPKYKLNQ